MRRLSECRYLKSKMRRIATGCALTLAAVFLATGVPSRLALAQAVGLVSPIEDAAANRAEANAQVKFKVLHTFTGRRDGGQPWAGLLSDPAGNLYGTTQYGGDISCNGGLGCGTVFKIDKTGKETVLHSFTLSPDGGIPVGDLLLASDGTLYGTTYFGGTGDRCTFNCGTVFKIDKTGKYAVLYSFKAQKTGGRPLGGLAQDKSGTLYGTTQYFGGPGTRCTGTGCGVAFKLDKAGRETVLHAFNNIGDVGDPTGDVVLDAHGNFYGTGWSGGSTGNGGVWKIDKAGKETVLYSFTGGSDGGLPQGGLVPGNDGNLYGTSSQGGTYSSGTVFEVSEAGVETVLYSFGARPYDGLSPKAPLVLDSAGNFYGTTPGGGYNDAGTVFKLDKTDKETILYSFDGINDGGYSDGRLIRDSKGNLYGTTSAFGKYGQGVVFKISTGAQWKVGSPMTAERQNDPQ